MEPNKRIENFKAYLDKRKKEGVINCRKLFFEIQQQGFRGSYFSVYRYIKSRNSGDLQNDNRGFHRFETKPGEQAQVDWGSFGKIEINERIERLSFFVYLLGYSRALYVEFTTKQNLTTFQQCHMHAFERLGIPKSILYDNVKTVVLRREKFPDRTYKFHYNPGFLDFSQYYGFEIKLCMPYWPKTKGKVESGVKYIKNNLLQGMKFEKSFSSLAELNKKAKEWIDTIADERIHGTTEEKPIDRWKREKSFLRFPQGLPPYNTSPFLIRYSTGDGLIQYRSNFYSIPVQYARKKLYVREINVNGIVSIAIYYEDKFIGEHNTSHGRGEWIIDDKHLASNLLNKANKNTKRELKRNAEQQSSFVGVRPLSYYDQIIPK